MRDQHKSPQMSTFKCTYSISILKEKVTLDYSVHLKNKHFQHFFLSMLMFSEVLKFSKSKFFKGQESRIDILLPFFFPLTS